jgi:long-chain acyl-CoA synthetase
MVEVSVTSLPASSLDLAGAAGSATLAPGSYGRVAAWLSKRVEVALSTVDLTIPQYRVLGILTEGSLAASNLAERLAVRRPSITAVVDGLVARGLVDRRQEDVDRRRVALRLTERGAQVLTDADRAVDGYLETIASHLPAEEEAAALRSLQLWGRAMTAARRRPRPGVVDSDEAIPGATSRKAGRDSGR